MDQFLSQPPSLPSLKNYGILKGKNTWLFYACKNIIDQDYRTSFVSFSELLLVMKHLPYFVVAARLSVYCKLIEDLRFPNLDYAVEY